MDPSRDRMRRALFASELQTDDFMPAAASVRADIAARSHRGRSMAGNDDHYLVIRLGRYEETLFTSLTSRDAPRRFDEYAYAAVVADGIGSAGAGAMAARLAISTLAQLELRFGEWDMRIDPETAAEIMDRSRWFFDRTHETVLRWYRAHMEAGRMAATLTGTYSAGTDLFVANVGHSRCYLFRAGLLTQLTRDQTLRERLSSVPRPTPVGQALEDGPHILTNAIGAEADEPGVMVEHFRLIDDDCVLLCTNGLTDAVTDDEIVNVLSSRRTPEEQCDLLIDLAVTRGAPDDVTVVLANYRVPDVLSDQP
jgi:serine/threonine protein phosphatase PrpC